MTIARADPEQRSAGVDVAAIMHRMQRRGRSHSAMRRAEMAVTGSGSQVALHGRVILNPRARLSDAVDYVLTDVVTQVEAELGQSLTALHIDFDQSPARWKRGGASTTLLTIV